MLPLRLGSNVITDGTFGTIRSSYYTLPDTGLSKLTRSEQKPFYKNHFKTRIGCDWSLVTMLDQKRRGCNLQ